jgi:hypothetical protein
VVVDGEPCDVLDRVSWITFTADSRHFVHHAEANGKMLVIADGRRGKEFDEVLEHFVSSAGGGFAYVARTEKQHYLVAGDREYGPFEQVHGPATTFSPDGSRLCFVARAEGTWRVYLDGQALREGGAGPAAFSPDGQHVAFAVGVDKDFAVVRDGTQEDAWVGLSDLRFSPDGKRLAYRANDGTRWFLIVDGKVLWPAVWEAAGEPAFSPDGKHVACVGTVKVGDTPARQTVVLDGKLGKEYDGIGAWSLRYLPNGRLVYVATAAGRSRVVVDKKEHDAHDEVAAPSIALSPDGKRVTYAAHDGGEWFVVSNGKAGKRYKQLGAGPVAFASDGKHAAYKAMLADDRWVIVLDGKEFGPYDAALAPRLAFSPDGRHLAWFAEQGGNRRLFVDGLEAAALDEAVTGTKIVWTSGEGLFFLANIGEGVTRVDVKIARGD